jgi:hypothetical protein
MADTPSPPVPGLLSTRCGRALEVYESQVEWQTVYDLHDDPDHVPAVQRATLTTREFGIEPTHGLFGSDEWWQQIARGTLPLETLKGTITRVYMGSMGDWPEFEMTCANGSSHAFTRFQTLDDGSRDDLYRNGRSIEVSFVWQECRHEAPEWGLPRRSPCVINIRIAAA